MAKGGKTVRTVIRSVSRAIVAMALVATILAIPAASGVEADQAGAGAKEVRSGTVQVRLHDAPLLDQDGRKVRFATDALGERIVVVDTFFTSCGLICPILSAVFADLQDLLGSHLDREVRLVSITVDPLTDIPPRLKKYADQWEARPGWRFLTGEKKEVDHVLAGLGLYSADFTEHPPAFLVGDVREGTWTRFYGFATPEQLMGKVRELLEKRKAKT